MRLATGLANEGWVGWVHTPNAGSHFPHHYIRRDLEYNVHDKERCQCAGILLDRYVQVFSQSVRHRIAKISPIPVSDLQAKGSIYLTDPKSISATGWPGTARACSQS